MGTLADFIDVASRERGCVLMGVLNITPDSFFDGGRYADASSATEQIDRLLKDGADLIDIGAESTRPGAEEVPAEEQLKRAEPAIVHAVARGALVSVDTSHPDVARRALALGARVINDVSCLGNPDLARAVSEYDADLIIMHSRGAMNAMPGFSRYPDSGYEDVINEVRREWLDAKVRALGEGLKEERLFFDPGLGFHKNAEQSAEVLRFLDEFLAISAGICVGASRKSFIGALDGSAPAARLGGTIAACLRAVDHGAKILRVHDVHDVRQALTAYRAFAAPTSTRSDGSRRALENSSRTPGSHPRGARHDA